MITEAPQVVPTNLDDELFRLELLVARRADALAQAGERSPAADLNSWARAEEEILGVETARP